MHKLEEEEGGFQLEAVLDLKPVANQVTDGGAGDRGVELDSKNHDQNQSKYGRCLGARYGKRKVAVIFSSYKDLIGKSSLLKRRVLTIIAFTKPN